MSTHDPTNGGARAVEPDPRDKGLGELVKDLASQTSTLGWLSVPGFVPR